MLGYNVFAAESEEEAVYLRSSALQAMLQLRRGIPIQLPPPVAGFEETLTGPELAMLEMITSCSAVGAVDSVAEQMASFLARTGADELMCVGSIYDHEKRLESFRLAAAARDKLTEKAA
jgi:alkanesulfonate monooxygenase SsuD/methylene tetrahydromethanopterin reductase-like flavin-dependent oxidoreductase (luciferase family)